MPLVGNSKILVGSNVDEASALWHSVLRKKGGSSRSRSDINPRAKARDTLSGKAVAAHTLHVKTCPTFLKTSSIDLTRQNKNAFKNGVRLETKSTCPT